jgi:hypothetical protein
MVRTDPNKQVSELIFQALSDESISMAEPMNDFDIKVLAATIERLVSEEVLPGTSDLVTEPQRIITMLQENRLDNAAEKQARKTLRRFREVLINLSSEPEIKILN